ncbi:MAG: class I SAM-dependent methyltransferase, partial [Methylococcales bacterium]
MYLPIVEPLKMVYEHPDILDLGCGRGEWLELMKNNGFDTKGIDLDEGMLEDCIDLSLDVYQVDVLEYLRGLDADSVCLVSALHLVEHINFDKVLNLVSEALRVLKPGGLLILETPNSENLVVGTSNFYLDPTHQKPLPAELLSFVAEYAGFCRVKTLYLQESPDLTISHRTTLINVLQGVSPDYAIIAQKTASSDVLNLFDASINHVYGIRLNDLAERYDQQNELKIQSLVNSYLSFTNKSFQEREVIYERRFEELFQE